MTDIGVYRITNTTTKKVYIGSSAKLKHRHYCHKWDLKKGQHHSLLLQRSWDKHGEVAFVFEVIEPCSREELPEVEQKWIDFYDAANPQKGYNRSPTAGTTAGCVKSSETCEKIAASKRGSIPWNKGLKGAQKWAADDPRRTAHPTKGMAHTAEARAAISQTKKAKGQKPTKEAIEIAAAKRRGKPGHTNQKTRLKELWADPVWRANMLEKRREARAAKCATI
jgi:group I intron endonuclease